jgi:hypothetical protein
MRTSFSRVSAFNLFLMQLSINPEAEKTRSADALVAAAKWTRTKTFPNNCLSEGDPGCRWQEVQDARLEVVNNREAHCKLEDGVDGCSKVCQYGA